VYSVELFFLTGETFSPLWIYQVAKILLLNKPGSVFLDIRFSHKWAVSCSYPKVKHLLLLAELLKAVCPSIAMK